MASVMNNEGGVKISICARASPRSTVSRPLATIIPLRVSGNEMPAEVKVCLCKRSSRGRHIAVKMKKNLQHFIESNFLRADYMKITELEPNTDHLNSLFEILETDIKDMYYRKYAEL